MQFIAAVVRAQRGKIMVDCREHDDVLRSHVSLRVGEAERLPFADGEFDHLSFTYLLRYVDDPAATLRELARVYGVAELFWPPAAA